VSVRPSRLVLLAVPLLLGLPSWSCGKPTEAVPAAPAAAPGGVLRMVQEAPRSLDPLDSDSVYESLPVNQIFDTLVRTDASLNVVPALAESWTISRDGRTYDFGLRPGVRFHDGTSLGADDVVFTIQRALRRGPSSLVYPYLLVIEGAADYAAGRSRDLPGVEAVDPLRVRIRLARPYPSFLEVLAMDSVGIVPRSRVQSGGEKIFARAPIGTGPFRLAEWTEQRMVLRGNTEHFGGVPRLGGIEIGFLRADESDFGEQRFAAGQLDLLEPSTESLRRLAEDPDVKLYRYQELALSFLGLNTKAPPLDQVWLRQAIAYALDRDGLVRDSPDVRRNAVGILPTGIPDYTPASKALEHDPERARELLARSGHPGGAGIPPIRLHNPSQGTAVMRVVERIRADLAAVGLRLEVVPLTWAEMSERLENETVEAFLLAWVADLSDPDAFMSMFRSDGTGNYFGYRDARTDSLLLQGAAELDPMRRGKIYRSIERRVLEQAPLVPLYHTLGIVAARPGLKGLEPGPLGLARVELEKVWIAETDDAS